MGIPADVEAVCLRALEKDRDKRWQDMDAFYRALGQAGGEPFEPTGMRMPVVKPSGRYETLATPNPTARELRTELPAEPVAGSFTDERPVVRRSAGLKLIGVVIAVAVVGALAMVGLSLSGKGGPPTTSAGAVAPPTPAAVPPPPATAPPAPVEPAKAPEAAPPAAAAPEEKPSASSRGTSSSRSRSRRSSGDLARDIAAKAGVDKEPAAPSAAPEKPAPTTPAELKNPFGGN
jgi:hypothetical protein